jgi:hypothetical protein
MMNRPPPELLVWTRMQAEAGQGLERIVARKERERRLNGGTFLWGVGSAPARAIATLASTGVALPVVFSRMLSKPKTIDAAPASIVAWTRIVGADGVARPLPEASIVTSRHTGRGVHYCLHCRSDAALTLSDDGPFDPGAYRNHGDAGGPVGASQVTSLLTRTGTECEAPAYAVSMAAMLVEGMWTRLLDPIHVPDALRYALDQDHDDASWLDLAMAVRTGTPAAEATQNDLFG